MRPQAWAFLTKSAGDVSRYCGFEGGAFCSLTGYPSASSGGLSETAFFESVVSPPINARISPMIVP